MMAHDQASLICGAIDLFLQTPKWVIRDRLCDPRYVGAFYQERDIMPVLNRFADFHQDIAAWRQHLHAEPELQFAVHKTASFVADKLREFGLDEVTEGIGRTGVVGVIKGRANGSGRVIGLRADMDALPIQEVRDLPYKSGVVGKMHACGHDGHTAMLLGAAKYLAETRNFDGTVIVIFQPAEEGGGGGREMVKDGLMERWSIDEVYGMHNLPGMDVGQFGIRTGGIMAATDQFDITVTGRGGHAAMPHKAIDPAIIVSQLVQAFQTIVSRNADPMESIVVTVTQIHMGDAYNVIPQQAKMAGTVRTLAPALRELGEKRLTEICAGIAAAFDAEIKFVYHKGYPVTVNHPAPTDFAVEVAEAVVGKGNVDANYPATMGGEDFSYMLEARPGAFIFVGQGDTASLHHPEYDFNDEIIPIGCSYWARLVETKLAA